MKFAAVLERESDGGFGVTVPVLPGCVSREEAITNIREAVEHYVEYCRLAGVPIPPKDSVEYVELVADIH